MYKNIKTDVKLPGFDDHYNHDPAKLTKIEKNEFFEKFTHYHWEYIDSRQVNKISDIPRERGRIHDLSLWINSAWGLTVGVAIVKTNGIFSYAEFGPWKEYTAKFVAQFQNDRS